MKNFTAFFIFLFSVFFISPNSMAQRNRPVFGDAIRLTSLLQKDYSTIPNEDLLQEITVDQTEVILLLRAYAELDSVKSSVVYPFVDLKNKYEDYVKEKKENENSIKRNRENSEKSISLSFDAKNAFFSKLCTLRIQELKELGVYFEKNKSLQKIIEDFGTKYEKAPHYGQLDPYASLNYQASVHKSIPFIGGEIAFETVMDGLAQFITDQIKAEIVFNISSIVKKNLNEESENHPYFYFKKLLPQTNLYISSFDASNFSGFKNEVKQYLENDLNNLLLNTYSLGKTDSIKAIIVRNPIKQLSLEGLLYLNGISQMRDETDIFTLFYDIPFLEKIESEGEPGPELKNLLNTVKAISWMGYSLTIQENDGPAFVNLHTFDTYIENPHFYSAFVGFMQQQNEKYYKIEFFENDKPYKISDAFSKDTSGSHSREKVVKALKTATAKAEDFSLLADGIKRSQKRKEKLSADTVVRFANSGIIYLESLVAGVNNFNEALGLTKDFRLVQNFEGYSTMARQGVEIFQDLQEKKVSSALIKAFQVKNDLRGFSGEPKVELPTLRFINFINDVSLAEDADQMKVAFESFAQPSKTSAQKRSALQSLSVSAFPGLFLGVENPIDRVNTEQVEPALALGITSPIGVDLVWRRPQWGKSKDKIGKIHGVFFSLIDIAAITRFRLDGDNSTEMLPEFTFENVLAPGFYYIFNFGTTPFIFGIGGQYGPEFKKIDSGGDNFSVNSFRFGVHLTYDIPIFNFYTK